MIVLTKAAKSFGSTVALQPTDLTFERGTTTALIGPSGCGKSTILRLIVGLLTPTSGAVEVDGVPVNSESAQALRRTMGYVIQDGGLFPHLTAEQNVLLMSRHLNQERAAANARLHELCALTHFPEDGLSRYPAQLSGGQRQRVSLMRALQLNPNVLLLDEPLGALDSIVRASLQTELKGIFGTLGKTVILVTHDLAEAAYLADTLILMRDGYVVQSGTLDELRDRPAEPFVSEFIRAQRSLVTL